MSNDPVSYALDDIEGHLGHFKAAVASIQAGDRSERNLLDAQFYGKQLIGFWNQGRSIKLPPDATRHKTLLAQAKQALEHALELREITQDVPDSVKDTLIKDERVHPIADKEELTRNRLAPKAYELLPDGQKRSSGFYSKHAYGVFLPWENEPSCVVYTAHNNEASHGSRLQGDKSLPGDIAAFRFGAGEAMAKPPSYVMFYSISNITDELPGFRLGPILLGKLEKKLNQEYELAGRDIAYSTLSPVRLFPKWLHEKLQEKEADPSIRLFTIKENQDVATHFHGMTPEQVLKTYMPIEPVQRKGRTVFEVVGNPPVFETAAQHDLFNHLREELCLEFLACARLSGEKNRKWMHNTAYDDVADFHLGNGAYIGNIALQPLVAKTAGAPNPEWNQAGGVMANYVYSPQVSAFEDIYKAKAEKTDPLGTDSKIILSDHLFQRLCTRHPQLGRGTINKPPLHADMDRDMGEIREDKVMSLKAAKLSIGAQGQQVGRV